MIVVVDASVLVAALADPGPDGAWAEEVLLEDRLMAPQLAMVETTNILRRLEASGGIRTAEADAAVSDLLALDIAVYDFRPLAGRIWELRVNLTSYDAWYVALAEAHEVPMATLDKRIARATGPRCSFIVPDD